MDHKTINKMGGELLERIEGTISIRRVLSLKAC